VKLKRRHVFLTGGAAICAGLLTYGGSAAVCSTAGTSTAGIIRPLFVALADIPEPDVIGREWLARTGAGRLSGTLLGRADLVDLSGISDAQDRRRAIGEVVRSDFARNGTVVVNNWVVAEAEALIAGAWMSGARPFVL